MCKEKCRCGRAITKESKKYSPTECLDCFIANESAEQRRDKEFDAMERFDKKVGENK